MEMVSVARVILVIVCSNSGNSSCGGGVAVVCSW